VDVYYYYLVELARCSTLVPKPLSVMNNVKAEDGKK